MGFKACVSDEIIEEETSNHRELSEVPGEADFSDAVTSISLSSAYEPNSRWVDPSEKEVLEAGPQQLLLW